MDRIWRDGIQALTTKFVGNYYQKIPVHGLHAWTGFRTRTGSRIYIDCRSIVQINPYFVIFVDRIEGLFEKFIKFVKILINYVLFT